jgi:hypothetical protein
MLFCAVFSECMLKNKMGGDVNELKEILTQIKTAGERLESFSNNEKNFNHSFSGDLEHIALELYEMSENISIIREYFFAT